MMMYRGLLILLLFFCGCAQAQVIQINNNTAVSVGLFAQFYAESSSRISVDSAISAYQQGAFTPSSQQVLTFGIGANPHWIAFELYNDRTDPIRRFLSIETAWLDQIDTYLIHDGQVISHRSMGDQYPFHFRPLNSRLFAIEQSVLPGNTLVLLRVESPDPLLLPIYLRDYDAHQHYLEFDAYSYGLLYGVMLALLFYNLMLYSGIKHRQYLYYAIYLFMFVLMNLSYTGHAFRWLWPDAVQLQQWANPLLMILYSVSGLIFAIAFLDIRKTAPKLATWINRFCIAIMAGLMIFYWLPNGQQLALYLSFSTILIFTILMLLLGIVALCAGNRAAYYFLVASAVAAIGGTVTALTVWGVIPYHLLGYRAVDIGTVIEAILLALALAAQFRRNQRQRLKAERMARLDPLTGLNNRRAFSERAEPFWQNALRHQRPISVAILDLDEFKLINDQFGHKVGDQALESTAEALTASIRAGDVLARWGGEEFIILMPETSLDEASKVSERLRLCIHQIHIREKGADIRLSASIGVATRLAHMENLEQLIYKADQCLFQAKAGGRNCVVVDML
ncbi:MAG: GGDEF domain-containing protein [Oceanospirillales bacterium]|nr:MAG: GGDEF domain-containing protein [Oceanospirillales bacterium]